MEEGSGGAKRFDWKSFLLSKQWVLLLLIPLIITLVVRLEPARLVPLESAAEANVINFYRSQVTQAIAAQYPNLPEETRKAQAEESLKRFLQDNREQVQNQIREAANSLKSQLQYQSGKKSYAYIGDIDSYYWLRMARNIVEKGSQCDFIDKENGFCMDSYTTAPKPKGKVYDYYPVVIVGVYSTLRLVNPDLSLMQASFLTPLVLSLILTIPLFLLLRRIGGNTAAVIGTVLVNVNPFVLSRTLGSDSDIVNIFFQAFFLWLAIGCFYAKTARARSLWAFSAGLCLSLYSLFWIGWWYLADLFLLALFLKGGYAVLHDWLSEGGIHLKKGTLQEFGFTAGAFLLAVIIFFGMLFNSPSALVRAVGDQIKVLSFKVAANPNLWPNVLPTVAEFNSLSVRETVANSQNMLGLSSWIVGAVGVVLPSSFENALLAGMPLYLMAVLGIIFLIFPSTRFIRAHFQSFLLLLFLSVLIYFMIKGSSSGLSFFLLMVPVLLALYLHLRIREEADFYPDVVFLLTIIIVLVSYFATTGVRFLFLMVIPVSIFASLFLVRAGTMLFSTLGTLLHAPKRAVRACLLLVLIMFMLPPVKYGFATSQSYLPNVTDAWVETLEKIRNESKPNAIINSWWDFGHWFKYFADRGVTLDGSSQNSPQLHWLGKLLLTSDENLSRGILRMLDCGANDAFATLLGFQNDTPFAYDLLNEIIAEDQPRAKALLIEHGLTESEAEKVLAFSHCDPPEDFLITSEDMIGKGGVWAHFGSWDFKKSYLNAAVGKQTDAQLIEKFQSDYDVPSEQTKQWIQEYRSLRNEDNINAWIAPWPSYLTGLNRCENRGNVSVCAYSQGGNQFPVVVDYAAKQAFIERADGLRAYPAAVSFLEGESYELVRNTQDPLGFGIATKKEGDNVQAAFMSPELVGSMFTRLFFFDGVGLHSFEKFHDTTTLRGERIITWKVVWEPAAP